MHDLKNDMDEKIFSDQSGRFPTRSYKGNQYIMVLYKMDVSNSVHAEPMRNRTSGEMVRAYQAILDRLKAAGINPSLHILDNECSQEFKDVITSNQLRYQLVPPNDHRRNAAEKAMQVWKDHFVSVLCGTDDAFPMQLWCKLVPHAVTQLNMLRRSKASPEKSAFAHLRGNHNFDAHPFAILGCLGDLVL